MFRNSPLPLGALLALASDLTAATPESRVSVVSSMDKFRKDQQPTSISTRLDLFAARGEAESGQIVISALEGELSGVTLEALELAEGHVLKPEVHLVGYVPINRPSRRRGRAAHRGYG
jgi:hypothetical protein